MCAGALKCCFLANSLVDAPQGHSGTSVLPAQLAVHSVTQDPDSGEQDQQLSISAQRLTHWVASGCASVYGQ